MNNFINQIENGYFLKKIVKSGNLVSEKAVFGLSDFRIRGPGLPVNTDLSERRIHSQDPKHTWSIV